MSAPNCVPQRAKESFNYPPFPKDQDAIRILTISPGDFYSPICSSLTTVAFVNKPKYAALSYTWEMPFPDGTLLPLAPEKPQTHTLYQASAVSFNSAKPAENITSSRDLEVSTQLPTINVNDTAMPIRQNLYLALLHLRSPTHSLPLWVDAICINQKDKTEVSSQVALMSFIYSKAHTVVAWLGPREFKLQIDMFHYMSDFWKMGQSRHLGAVLAQARTSITSRDPELEAIARISTSTYWSRLWIVQENCLARDLMFAYGHDIWTFDGFVKTLEGLRLASQAGSDASSEAYSSYRSMLRLLDCRTRRYTVMSSLETLVETFQTQLCGNVMDRIYALLGMAYDVHPVSGSIAISDQKEDHPNETDLRQDSFSNPTRGRGFLKVDYTSSLYELWVEVVKFVYFRAKSRKMTAKLAQNHTLRDQERRISIVRTAGVIQAALDQSIEVTMPPIHSMSSSSIPRQPKIRAIGFLSGKLLHLGPEFSSLIGSFQATQDWFSEWEISYTEQADLEKLHELHDHYMNKLWDYSDEELKKIRDIDSLDVFAWRVSADSHQIVSASNLAIHSESSLRPKSNSPRIFLGSSHLIGLAPPAAQVGDVVVQFWNCDAALVMRPSYTESTTAVDSIGCSASSFSLVGRADLVNLRNEKDPPDSDSWAEGHLCGCGDVDESSGVYVDLDFATLQAITASIRT